MYHNNIYINILKKRLIIISIAKKKPMRGHIHKKKLKLKAIKF